jgi:hypothetical protein
VKNRGAAGAWYKHGAYLDREGTQQYGRGRGFDAQGTPVKMSTWLARCQRAGDPHLYKVMLSPEHGDRLNLREFTQAVLRAVERDLGRPLEWAAIDHYNTSHPHVHVCIRGMSHGAVVTMARSYLHGGMQERAREVATRLLGIRLAPELEAAAQRAVGHRAWSALDTALQRKLSPERTLTDAQLTPWERARVQTLAERGLAWPVAGGWQLSSQWEDLKMRDTGRPKKEPAVEHEEEKPQPRPERAREAERDQDEQQRRAVVIDDLEQDVGWER